jgi:hypothetical protein
VIGDRPRPSAPRLSEQLIAAVFGENRAPMGCCPVEDEASTRSGRVAAKRMHRRAPSPSPTKAAVSSSAASMTATRSSACCSSVGAPVTGSERPVPRLSKRTTWAKRPARSRIRLAPGFSHSRSSARLVLSPRWHRRVLLHGLDRRSGYRRAGVARLRERRENHPVARVDSRTCSRIPLDHAGRDAYHSCSHDPGDKAEAATARLRP